MSPAAARQDAHQESLLRLLKTLLSSHTGVDFRVEHSVLEALMKHSDTQHTGFPVARTSQLKDILHMFELALVLFPCFSCFSKKFKHSKILQGRLLWCFDSCEIYHAVFTNGLSWPFAQISQLNFANSWVFDKYQIT